MNERTVDRPTLLIRRKHFGKVFLAWRGHPFIMA